MNMETEEKIPLECFEKLYVSWFSRMKGFAQEYVVSEEDAENIVQDVFTELWERKELLTYAEMNWVALLFTSIKNKCIDLLRHRIVVQEAVNRMQEEYQITLRMKLDSLEIFDQSILSEQDIEQLISDAIDSLPENYRKICYMNLENLNNQEIADRLHVSLNTVKYHKKNIYRILRDKLKDL